MAFTCRFKAVVSNCITTKNDKLPDFEVSCPENPLHILKQYHLRRAIRSPTLSILSPLTCKFSPAQQSDKLSSCQEKQATISLYKAIPTTDQAHGSWRPITKLQLTSLATEQTIWWTAKERGVSFIPGSCHGYITPWCPWGLTKTALDDILGWQIMSMYILPHWPISKHNKNTVVTGKLNLRRSGFMLLQWMVFAAKWSGCSAAKCWQKNAFPSSIVNTEGFTVFPSVNTSAYSTISGWHHLCFNMLDKLPWFLSD